MGVAVAASTVSSGSGLHLNEEVMIFWPAADRQLNHLIKNDSIAYGDIVWRLPVQFHLHYPAAD
jgi:hypothetical protein